jgi:hypothetical protein
MAFAQIGIVDQALQRALQRGRIVGRNEQRGAIPEFTQTVDVAQHERTARQRGVEHRQA